jgi:ubiquinone/menaquinone biosynthesis C-methylase UbiE
MHLDHASRLDFVLTLRRRWSDTLYVGLTQQVGDADGEPSEVAEQLPLHSWFAWLERASQKMLWRATQAVVLDEGPSYDSQPDHRVGSLSLDPNLELPDWYTAWDIHVQPGGIWRNRTTAEVYDLGAKLVMLGENDDYLFHTLFAETAVPHNDYRRIVDLGCGFGKSAWPFARLYPDAEVIGIDLAAPCLQLGYEKCGSSALPVHFRQRDCRDSGLEDATADLVTSTMLLHELPPEPLEEVIVEAARILAPAGLLRMLDFRYTGDPLRDHVMTGHGVRNNEPYMPYAMAADTVAMCEAAGLQNARWVAFDERAVGRLDSLEWPERAEWHFPWAVLEAEKPT